MLSPNFHSDINKPFEALKVPALWPFLENSVQKCLKPIFLVWMILFAKLNPDTLKIDNLYHICIFYALLTLSFDSKILVLTAFTDSYYEGLVQK